MTAGAMIQALSGGKGDGQGLLVLLGVALFMAAVRVAAALGLRRALRSQPTEALRTD